MTRIAGRYELQEELAAQPPVRRFRALDVVSGESVFIKLLQVSGDEIDAFMRLQEDAAVVSSLNHPNIYRVYGAFVDNGMSYVIAEAVDGPSLGEVVQRERLSLARVKVIALQIASALAYGHDRNIVHRDLEPENILLAAGDMVKIRSVAEMGRARVVRGVAPPAPGSGPRAALYASPEQRRGQTVGPRTDLYSLGALMYHMVTARPPLDTFQGGELQFPADVPDEWQALIARALARNERYRFANAREMGEAIARLPAPGTPPMQFHVQPPPSRCSKCGREVRARFCPNCGTPVSA